MKILKVGNTNHIDQVECTCHKCKTVFLYSKSDVNVDREGRYINCPVCKKFIKSII